MFRSRSIISASIIAVCSLAACTVNTASAPNQGGGGEDTDSTAAMSSGGTSSTLFGSKGGSSSSLTGTGSTTGVSCKLGGSITSDTTWEPNAACPDGYDVTDTVTVSGAGTSLVIKPGTKLKFASGTNLDVQTSASLVAVGTADNPITFTGWQKLPGAWGGILIESGAVDNEIAHAIVEYGGQKDVLSANILVWYDQQPALLKLSNTQIRESSRFGLRLSENVTLAQFENNTITKNAGGAARTLAASVHQLRGTGNSMVDNGEGNIIQLETGNGYYVEGADVTWPNLAPAIYRVTGINGVGGGQIFVKSHLTIEPGAVFEFVGTSGIEVKDGASGLSAIGTATAPIVFRGIGGSGWTGIGFCESSWTGNALEEVQIANASGPTNSVTYCGAWSTALTASVLVGHNYTANASKLRVKNIKFSGPSNGETDLQVKNPSVLTLEGTNSGTGATGELTVQKI
jgi:hypothetical protein